MINLDNLEANLSNYIDMVGKQYDVEDKNSEIRITLYESLIAGALAIRAKSRIVEVNGEDKDISTKVIPIISAILNWLRQNDFYTGPASTRYHGSFHGGLLLHSLQTYNKMVELHQINSFNKINIESSTLIALTHDWCKIGKYEAYFRNEKNPKTHLWEEKLAYRWSDKYLALGHGPQSLMMLSQFCTNSLVKLTFDEMAAIRWHMYTYDVTSFDVDDLNKCNNKIPLVRLIQFADQLAIGEY